MKQGQDKEQHFLNNKEKISYLKYYNHTNGDRRCTAIFSNLATASTWTSIGCNDRFDSNYFICEQPVSRKNEILNYYSNHVKIQKVCFTKMIYVGGYCWLLKVSNGLQQMFSILPYSQPVIDQYLTSRFLGSSVSLYIAIELTKTQKSTCLTANSRYHHRYRGWKQVECSTGEISHVLVKTPAIPSKAECNKIKHFRCKDGSCILNIGRCDGVVDCRDHSDEELCSFPCKQEVTDRCSCELSFKCKLGPCVFLWHRCDRLSQCDDNSDEEDCAFVMFPRNDRQMYIDNHLQAKRNGSCKDDMLQCNLGQNDYCYHQHAWCIYEVLHTSILHCPGLEHLQFCERYECPHMFLCNYSYCIPLFMVCNGVPDCPSGIFLVVVVFHFL